MKTLTVIGAGKVGQVFAQQFVQHQLFTIQQICNRSLASGQQAVAVIGEGSAVYAIAQLTPSDIYLLTVPDDHIAATCQSLADAGLLAASNIVFHCSGAKASSELVAAIVTGAAVASVHPVRSFADAAYVAANFSGTICSLEGDGRALDVLLPAIQKIGAQTVQISAENKLLYHAGSVFASNYLVTLMDIALHAYEAAGIPPELAKAMAQPLAQQSLDNVFQLGSATALTGPIARGDMATVIKQQQVVSEWDASAGALYQAFTPLTVALAQRKQIAYSEK